MNEAHFAVLPENLCSRIFLKNFNYAEAFHGSWVTQYFSVDFKRWLFSIELKIPSDLISTVGLGQREKVDMMIKQPKLNSWPILPYK